MAFYDDEWFWAYVALFICVVGLYNLSINSLLILEDCFPINCVDTATFILNWFAVLLLLVDVKKNQRNST